MMTMVMKMFSRYTRGISGGEAAANRLISTVKLQLYVWSLLYRSLCLYLLDNIESG